MVTYILVAVVSAAIGFLLGYNAGHSEGSRLDYDTAARMSSR